MGATWVRQGCDGSSSVWGTKSIGDQDNGAARVRKWHLPTPGKFNMGETVSLVNMVAADSAILRDGERRERRANGRSHC